MEGLGSFLLFAAFFYFMMRFGCGAHMMHGHGGHKQSHGNNSDAKHHDPVCGMEVKMDKGYGKMHEGTLYRFCSRNCLDKFDTEPERYLKQLTEESGGER
ncbi:MAG: YHS domain-containing protein [Candidatus Polarisedimenticolaceae bacterium]|nr:YHS domain-containing protein [Candidatus Polarisedimenticolaceae bacterium]